MNRFDNLTYVTEGLEPKNVLRYFEQLSQIPRGSGNEQEVSDYLKAFGENLGLDTIQDDVLNIIIKKPGTSGYENSDTIILQGHMDMVCEKNEDTIHDFQNDPLKLYIEGDLLKAKGTTLGADNGIAVAYAMAILASDDIPHPPLEVIVTVEEETGMGGVIGFQKENVSGKTMINMDSEEEGVFFASCAGGVRANILLDIEREANEMPCYKVMIKDLKGGHSGLNIADGRGNAIKLLGRMLYELKTPYNLVEIFGGSKPNAIPREAYAVVATKDLEAFKNELTEIENTFNKELTVDGLSIVTESFESRANCYSSELTERILQTLIMIPCGVQSMSFAIEGLVESSLNIGVLSEQNDQLVFESAIRSSIRTLKYEILNRVEMLAKLVRGRTEVLSDYPEWAYNSESKLQGLFVDTYERLSGEKGEIAAIHAGLECGFFAEKLTDTDGSDLDMISFGPNMANVHTPYEELSLSSVERSWKFLKEILKALQ